MLKVVKYQNVTHRINELDQSVEFVFFLKSIKDKERKK